MLCRCDWKYLFKNKLISKQQHGFLAKHSTCTQVLETINDWSISLSNSNVVDIVYFDIARAFEHCQPRKVTS